MLKLKDNGIFCQQCLIDGTWVNADSGDTITVRNPATGDTLGTVPKMGAAETRRAIDAANAALPGWRAKTAGERAKLLRRWYELLLENQDDLGLLMTSEQGKPLAEAKGEIAYAASYLEWFAEEGKRAYGEIVPPNVAGRRILVTREPAGVCAAITPWNFPAAMITRKAGAALAAGCTMVVKPASQTPFSALALAELAVRAGIPAGVFNVVTGSAKAIGGEICANRLLVQDGVYDAFAEKLATAVSELKVGNGVEPGVTQGPLIDQCAVDKVEELIADAREKGARIVCGGQRHALGQTFFEPTILADVTREMRVAREEIFGPVAPLFRFQTEEDAIRMANDTEFGLASYFFSRDVGRIFRVSEALEYGMVGVNTGLISTEVAPFGGVKASGLGREGSRHGLDDYLEIKYVCVAGLDR